MKVRGRSDNLFSILFILPEKPPQENAPNRVLYQKFTLFINQPKVKKYIQDLRLRCGIKPEIINRKINEFKDFCRKEGKIGKRVNNYIKKKNIPFENRPYAYMTIGRKMGWQKIKEKRRSNWDGLNRYINSKIIIDDIKNVLTLFRKPISWDISLSCYVLTNEIKTLLLRQDIMWQNNESIWAEVTPTTTFRELKEKWKEIHRLQPFLQGYGVKKERKKPKFEQIIKVLKAEEKYDDPYDKIDYVFGDDGSIDSASKLDNKRRAIIRKTKQRSKNYI
jgi:hypothetical protein